MTRRLRRSLDAALAVAALTLVALAGLALLGGGATQPVIAAALAAAGGLALWLARLGLTHHFQALERLRGTTILLGAGVTPAPEPAEPADDLQPLRTAIARLAARSTGGPPPDERLAVVLCSIAEAIVVITPAGQISLLNEDARRLLGLSVPAVGTSIFSALERDGLLRAMAAAAARDKPLQAMLRGLDGRELPALVTDFGPHGGAVLTFPAERGGGSMEHDLNLHDRPPAGHPAEATTPLETLPGLVLDTETTGLNPGEDRVVSIGAVRVSGARIHPAMVLDLLVSPGRKVPPRATSVHGITDAMLLRAPPYGAVHGRVMELARDCALIGHQIGFDIAMLRAEAARANLTFTPPPALDTMVLAAVLNPELVDLNLESIAAWLGVPVVGRHTALGDALVAAEIWSRLVPLLTAAGCRTLGQAQALAARRPDILAMQRRAGW